MCRLRGIIYLRLDQLPSAKQSFMEALSLDVRNFDVFLELTNSMMTPEEGQPTKLPPLAVKTSLQVYVSRRMAFHPKSFLSRTARSR